MVTLTKGTKEFFPIKVLNVIGTLTDLTGTGLVFDLYHDDEAETVVSTNTIATNQGMIALPLIDTAALTEGDYNVFIKFTVYPEVPRLGPFPFRVDD